VKKLFTCVEGGKRQTFYFATAMPQKRPITTKQPTAKRTRVCLELPLVDSEAEFVVEIERWLVRNWRFSVLYFLFH